MYGIIQVDDNGTIKTYQTSKTNYEELLSFDTEKYYLHDSDLEIPKQEICYEVQNKVLSELDENNKAILQKQIRDEHISMERQILEGIQALKDSNNPVWENNYLLTFNLQRTKELYNIVQNEQVKEDLKQTINLFEKAINEHSIKKLLEVHKIIHDYDYWIINYPPIEFEYAPPDWEGANTYFGTVSILK